MTTIKFWGNVVSQPSRMISYVMEKLDIEHEYIHTHFLKDTRSEEFKKNVNKFGKVPVIHVNDVRLAESASIARYLCSMYDTEEILYPKSDLKLRAKVDELLDWNGHSGKPNFSAAYVAISVGPRIVHSVPPTDEVFDKLMQGANSNLKFIDDLVKDNDFVIGDRFTIADIQLYNEVFNWQQFTGFSIDEYENIQRWMERVYEKEEVVRKLDAKFFELIVHSKPPKSPEVVLFGHYLSMPSRAVLYVLKKLGIDHLYKNLNTPEENTSREYKRQLNKTGKFPVIKHDGNVIIESATIHRYLCDVYDKDELLLPKTNRIQRAKVESFLDYCGNTVNPTLSRLFYELFVFPKLLGKESPNGEVTKEIIDGALAQFARLDEILSSSVYLAGDDFSVADIQIFNEIYQAIFCQLIEIDSDKFVHLAKWYDAIYNDPIVQEIDKEVQAIKKAKFG